LLEFEIQEENVEEILSDFSHVFCIEKITQQFENQNEEMNIEKSPQKVFSLEEIKHIEDLTPAKIDFENLIKNEKPLYGYDDKANNKFEFFYLFINIRFIKN